jgi:hypothetical protein
MEKILPTQLFILLTALFALVVVETYAQDGMQPVLLQATFGEDFHRSITINSQEIGSFLRIDCENCGYRDKTGGKVSYRVNGGSWQTIDQGHDDFGNPEAAGPDPSSNFLSNTAIFTIPMNIGAGANTVEYRLNYRSLPIRGGMSGARIVTRILNADKETLTPVVFRTFADYPIPSGDPVNGGETFSQLCGNCHVDNNGSGLVNNFFHPETITAQGVKAMDAGAPLTSQDIQDIARYMYDRQAVVSSIGCEASPMDPPFQPGPNVTPECWAQGAGYEWAPPTQRDVLSHVELQRDEIKVGGNFELNLIPRVEQFPGITGWFVPVDPTTISLNSPSLFNQVWNAIQVRLPLLAQRFNSGEHLTDPVAIKREIDSISNDLDNAKDLVPNSTGSQAAAEYESLQKMVCFALYGFHDSIGFQTMGELYNTSISRGFMFWPSGKQGYCFDTGQHIAKDVCWIYGIGDTNGCSSTQRGAWQAFMWYSVQANLASSDPSGFSLHAISPIDRKYSQGFATGHRNDTGIRRFGTVFIEDVEFMQLREPFGFSSKAWYARHTSISPTTDYLSSDPYEISLYNSYLNFYVDASISVYGDSVVVIDDNGDVVLDENGNWLMEWVPIHNIPRGTGMGELQPESMTLSECSSRDSGVSGTFDHCNHHYTALTNRNGVSKAVKYRLADWSKSAWPNIDWTGLISTEPEAPEPQPLAAWSPEAPIVIPPDTTDCNCVDTLYVTVTDTLIVTETDTVFVDVIVTDTLYVTVTDTVFVTVTDTVFVTQVDTVFVTQVDTVVVVDTQEIERLQNALKEIRDISNDALEADSSGGGPIVPPIGDVNATPSDNLQALIDGGVRHLILAPGVYRQEIILSGVDSLVIEGNGAILSGAEIFDEWSPRSDSVYAHHWPYNWFGDECLPMTNNGQNFKCDPYGFLSEIGVRREMVIIGGERVQQVISKYESLLPNTYFVDEDADSIYIKVGGPLPQIEVAVRSRGIEVFGGSSIAISDLTIQHVATEPDDQTGALRFTQSSDVRLDNVSILSNNWMGLSLDRVDGLVASGVSAIDNGFDGAFGHFSWDVGFGDCAFNENHWRAYQGGMLTWSVGNKFLKNHRLTFDNCDFNDNYTKGLWIDFSNEDVLVRGSRFRGNRGIGLALEANGRQVRVEGSEVVSNGGWGLEVRASYEVELVNNLIADNGAGFLSRKPEAGGRTVKEYDEDTREATLEYKIFKSQNWTVTGNTFRNNAGMTTNGRSQTLWFVDQEDNTLFDTSVWDNNIYEHAESGIFGFPSNFWVTFASWQSGTGTDTNSVYTQP